MCIQRYSALTASIGMIHTIEIVQHSETPWPWSCHIQAFWVPTEVYRKMRELDSWCCSWIGPVGDQWWSDYIVFTAGEFTVVDFHFTTRELATQFQLVWSS